MWRGFLESCRYSASCWSESLRPNHVFHQNRKGIRQISQAVTKKSSFWVRDMPGFWSGASAGRGAGIGLADMLVDMLVDGVAITTLRHRRLKRGPALDNEKRRIGPEAEFGA